MLFAFFVNCFCLSTLNMVGYIIMKKTETLKLNREFKRLYYKGKFSVCGCVVVYYIKTRRHRNRIGLTVGKNIGNAVKRNRAKRLIRESYRLSENRIKKGYDIVIVARASINGKKLDDVMRNLTHAMKKADLMIQENIQSDNQ